MLLLRNVAHTDYGQLFPACNAGAGVLLLKVSWDSELHVFAPQGNGDSRQLIGACCNFISTFVADRIKMASDPLQSDPGSPLHEGDGRAVYVAHEKGGATVETAKRCRRITQLRAIRQRLRQCHYKTKSYTEVPKRAGRRQLRVRHSLLFAAL